MTIHEMLNWRYATKQFDTSKSLPAEDLEYVLQAANLTATSYGLQPFGIVAVTNQALKDKLIEPAFNQTKVAQNCALLVFCARTDVDEAFISEYVERGGKERGVDPNVLADFKALMIDDLTSRSEADRLAWAQKQAYIALGTTMIAAAERKIDGSPMEGFNPAAFNDILGLDEHNLHATVLFAVGYRSPEDETQHHKKIRKDLGDLVVRM